MGLTKEEFDEVTRRKLEEENNRAISAQQTGRLIYPPNSYPPNIVYLYPGKPTGYGTMDTSGDGSEEELGNNYNAENEGSDEDSNSAGSGSERWDDE